MLFHTYISWCISITVALQSIRDQNKADFESSVDKMSGNTICRQKKSSIWEKFCS